MEQVRAGLVSKSSHLALLTTAVLLPFCCFIGEGSKVTQYELLTKTNVADCSVCVKTQNKSGVRRK